MFAIKDSKLYLAPKGVSYSHAKWFELEGWIKNNDDSLMNVLTRGYFDSTGVYFYKGYDFNVDDSCEKEMFNFLEDLVNKTSLDLNLKLYGGKIKQEKGGNWSSIRSYSSISNILSSISKK